MLNRFVKFSTVAIVSSLTEFISLTTGSLGDRPLVRKGVAVREERPSVPEAAGGDALAAPRPHGRSETHEQSRQERQRHRQQRR